MISFNENFKLKFNVYYFYTTSFLALIILQPETVKLNVAKSYILVDLVAVLALVEPAFLCEEVENLILWTFYITMDSNNRNYHISVSSLK